MKERPILFSAPMVRAILEGRKTQTRRVVKLNDAGRLSRGGRQWHVNDQDAVRASPYGQPGDRLWVRESFKDVASGTIKGGSGEIRYGVAYKADGAVIWKPNPTVVHDLRGFDTGPMQFEQRPWRPSIHMSRRASRITLEVTEVRVERLQDLSEADAIAEGVDPSPGVLGDDDIMVSHVMSSHDMRHLDKPMMPAPNARFVLLWDSINGKAPGVTNWNANPWVWVVSFRPLVEGCRG